MVDCRYSSRDIDPEYVYFYLKASRERYGFDRVFRASLGNVRAEIEVVIPIDAKTGKFDLVAQRKIADSLRTLEQVRQTVNISLSELVRSRLRVEDISM